MIRWINEQLGTSQFSYVKNVKDVYILDVRDLVDKGGNEKELVLEKINIGIEHINNNEKVVVCCDYGISRSNSIAVGILTKWKKINFDEALDIVREKTKEKSIKIEMLSIVRNALNCSSIKNDTNEKGILITGSSGFIGTAIIPKLSLKNKVYTISHSEINLLTDSLELDKFINTNHITHVLHLATPHIYQSNIAMGDTIVMLKNVIDVCEENNVHLIYTSSWEVYSGYKSNCLKASENLPLLPKGVYGETKFLCEKLIENRKKNNNSKITIVRSSPVYGVESDRPKFIYNFIDKAKSNDIIYVHKYINDLPRLDLLYIEDMCEILCKIVESDLIGEFNVGTESIVSTTEIAEIIIEKLKSKSRIEHRDINGYCSNIQMDATKVKNLFKWSPKTSIIDGIDIIIENINRKDR